jgi:small subunit ribosomal protein S16
MGKKKRPFYRLVVMDSRKRRDGAYLANLGYYNPFVEPFEVKLHVDQIIHWLRQGATISQTARSLLKSQGVLYRFSLLRQGMSPEQIEQAMSAWQASATARDARRAQQRAQDQQAAEAARAEASAQKDAEAAKAASGAQAGDTDQTATGETAGSAAESES